MNKNIIYVNKKKVKNFILFLVGTIIIALTFNLFCIPNNYVTGGLSGLSIILNNLFNIKISYIIFIGNLIITGLGIIFLGYKKTYRSIIGSFIYTIIIHLTQNLSTTINLEMNSIFLKVITIGFLLGIGCSLVYLAGYTSGGSDILSLILNEKYNLTFGKSSLIINIIILLFGTYIFGIEMLIISLIIRFIESKIIDNFLIGIGDSKVIFINTKEMKLIKKHIIEVLGSGVSEIKTTNGYTNTLGKILMCVVPSEKYLSLKNEIISLDKNAFITIVAAYHVYGGTNRYKLPFHDLRL